MSKIVILSSYRTGSTALCDALSVSHNIKLNYGEYFHNNNISKTDELSKFEIIKNNSFIIKITPDQVVQPYFDQLINCATNVYGIYRRNIVKQIASYYISSITNIWARQRTEHHGVHKIPINEEMLDVVIRRVLTFNDYYEKHFRPLCSFEYVYEEICNSTLTIARFSIADKPNNYHTLMEKISEKLKNM